MKFKNLYFATLLSIVSLAFFACNEGEKSSNQSNTKYEIIENDPSQTRIYTLDNGLKIYLSVNKEAPKVNTAIAVRAGSKNDPADATGLAHYLEHMLFKGTDKYGTSDFEKEKPLLNQIDSLYEVYRKINDAEERAFIYAQIDSISNLASTYAIANEYDKLVSELGATGTNAYTSFEQTVYINDIPSNQIDKWLQIEVERFRNPQFRLFHTELEAVYEEKNRTLDNDFRKAWYATFDGLFPKHQYGQQTTIGTIEHLKNPSVKEIRKYFDKYYVPNNMAICMAGDFDPDVVYEKIKEYFGGMERKDDPAFEVIQEEPIQNIKTNEVYGPDASFVYLAYRFEGEGSQEADLMNMADMILSNSAAGIIDLNLNQEQKVLGASSFSYILDDYSTHMFYGRTKDGQTLEEVKDLILQQIDSLKAGAFPDWLMEAIINDLKLSRIKGLESNRARVGEMVEAFILQTDWIDVVDEIDRLSKITKEEIVEFANTHYQDNYVITYKRTGEDKNVLSVEKPNITPVEVNREAASPFLIKMQEMEVNPIEPVFLDYKKEITEQELPNGIIVRSIENTSNDLFSLYYVFEMGNNNNKMLSPALQYLKYLGTDDLSPAEIKQEFYKIGCEYSISTGNERVYVSLSGLNENFEKGLQLLEGLLSQAKVNETAWENLLSDILKRREDSKLSKGVILNNGLMNFAKYGENNPFKNILSEEELNAINPQDLVDLIHSLNSYEHRVLYYGPYADKVLTQKLESLHQSPENLNAVPEKKEFVELAQTESIVHWVDYKMEQAEIMFIAKKEKFNPKTAAIARVYNEYFGGGMGSIVFQEMRESKALAYSVYSTFSTPSDSASSHYVIAYIGTQADKLGSAMDGMLDLLNNLPESNKSFDLAKKSALEKIRTQRITKASKLWNYESALRHGLDYDQREDVYKAIPGISMEDLKDFHKNYIQNSAYDIVLIGDKNKLDFEVLKEYGSVKELSLKDVFGY